MEKDINSFVVGQNVGDEFVDTWQMPQINSINI